MLFIDLSPSRAHKRESFLQGGNTHILLPYGKNRGPEGWRIIINPILINPILRTTPLLIERVEILNDTTQQKVL